MLAITLELIVAGVQTTAEAVDDTSSSARQVALLIDLTMI